LINLCIYCFDLCDQLDERGFFLCRPCQKQIAPFLEGQRFDLFPPTDCVHRVYSLVTLGPYEGELRSLLLRAKAQGDLRALRFLVKEFCTNTLVADLANKVEAVLPAPSSLWSRWRGKFDIAASMSEGLASCRPELALLQPPRELLWRKKKRAMLSSETKTIEIKDLERMGARPAVRGNGSPQSRLLLIVDDIVTSGFTMATIAALYPNDSVYLATIAVAPKLFWQRESTI